LDAATRSTPRASRARRRGGALLALASLLLCAALLEALSRGFWWIRDGVPPSEPGRLLETLYPELRPIRERTPAARDGTFDLLLLGGSVLHESWGQVESQILEQLARAGHRSVRVHNLAQAAHTTRDSLVKYAALGGARFDLVFVYHGINDARANAAPPEVFREDYSHLPWYELVNALAPAADGAALALPATLRFAFARLRQSVSPGSYAGGDRPRPEWLRHGAEPRSPAAFERNLAAILELAAGRGDRVALGTFALHVPPDYSLEAFREKRLDYLLFYSPIELWGERDHVVAAVAAHNEAVRRLAARPGVLLVDEERLVPRGARTFNDPCHLTNEGSEIFARNLVEAILASAGGRR
jgi:lysophospholipase L1-like esterase